MHILEIPSFFIPYGGTFCLDQAQALQAKGHEVRIISHVQLSLRRGVKAYVSLPLHRREWQAEGIDIIQTFQCGIPKVVRPNVMRWIRRTTQLYRWYEQRYGRPDVLHAHCAKWAGYAAMLIGKECGIPYVITEHISKEALSQEFGPAPSDAWQIDLLRQTYEGAAWVLPVAEELVGDTACYYGTRYKWQWVSNVIDTSLFHYQQRPSTEGRPFVFCSLANFDHRKGYDILAEAFRQVVSRGHNVKLCLAGTDTDSAACRRLFDGIQGVEHCGLLSRAEVAALLYRSDALVLPSRGEVQPLSVMEALSTGIPVVATESVPRCLRLEGCRIVDIDDAQAFGKAMSELSEGPRVDGVHLSEMMKRMASAEVVGSRLSDIFSKLQSVAP